MARTVLAFDLGGTKVSAAAVTEEGSILARRREPVAKRSFPETVGQIGRLAEELSETVRGAGCAGLIIPGIWNPRTGSAWAPNLWGMEHVPLLEALNGRLRLPVSIASDRAGSVLGEQWLGAARGLSDVVFLAVGTGIGAGIIAGGRLIEGHAGVGGAVGWMAIRDAWAPEYASRGCFETEAAGPALVAHIFNWGAAGEWTPELVVQAARMGDRAAVLAVRQAAQALGRGIANLVSTLNPELVVFGGGMVEAWDLFEAPLHEEFRRWAQPVAAAQARIVPSALGPDAGLFGAARLALMPGAARAGVKQ
jgi:glucokinase